MIPQLFRNQKPKYLQLSRMQTTTKISATYPQPDSELAATSGSIGFGIGGLLGNKRCLSVHSIRAERLKKDFWLYVVFNCASTPEIHLIRDPVKLGWKPLIKIEHYHIGPNKILQGKNQDEEI